MVYVWKFFYFSGIVKKISIINYNNYFYMTKKVIDQLIGKFLSLFLFLSTIIFLYMHSNRHVKIYKERHTHGESNVLYNVLYI